METSNPELRAAAVEFAKAGGDSTLEYFKKSYDLEFKSDDSPVTNADRHAERIIRDLIHKHFPDHGIIGEEYGSENEESDIVWVLDPIDGTLSFIHGVPFYTTLIGILVKNQPEVGVIYAPALGELASAAIGYGAALNGNPMSVRACSEIEKATFLSTDVTTYKEHGYERALNQLLDNCRVHRTWGDAYGHMMVAAGRADVMIDPILNIWDAAALLPIVKEAGGSFSDLSGNETIETGNALSTSHELKDSILHFFKS
jgi:myo-inositol-1(or 4)-monophosphatase